MRIATAHDVDLLRSRGLALAGLTIGWNVVEAVVAITAGITAGSIALVGFGFDSTVEVISSVVVVWQFRGEARTGYDKDRERKALRLIAGSFFVLAAYVTFESIRDLFFSDTEADESTVGIVLAALSLIVMPGLAVAKRRTADALGIAHVAGRLARDAAVRVALGRPARRPRPQRRLRVDVGRPTSRGGHRSLRVKEGIEAWRGDDGDD